MVPQILMKQAEIDGSAVGGSGASTISEQKIGVIKISSDGVIFTSYEPPYLRTKLTHDSFMSCEIGKMFNKEENAQDNLHLFEGLITAINSFTADHPKGLKLIVDDGIGKTDIFSSFFEKLDAKHFTVSEIEAFEDNKEAYLKEEAIQWLLVNGGATAVEDIGSTNCSLAIFANNPTESKPIILCKINTSLARSLNGKGGLPKSAKKATLSALAEHEKIIQSLIERGVDIKVRTIATAALRDADGQQGYNFAKKIADQTIFDPEIIDGEIEALLLGLSIRQKMPGQRVFAGDMGGGSFELAAIQEDGKIPVRKSFQFGTFRILNAEKRKAMKDKMQDTLREVIECLEDPSTIHLTGGIFKSLARTITIKNNFNGSATDNKSKKTEHIEISEYIKLAKNIRRRVNRLSRIDSAKKRRAEKESICKNFNIVSERLDHVDAAIAMLEVLQKLGVEKIGPPVGNVRAGAMIASTRPDILAHAIESTDERQSNQKASIFEKPLTSANSAPEQAAA